jgi:hypothetical protein
MTASSGTTLAVVVLFFAGFFGVLFGIFLPVLLVTFFLVATVSSHL